MYAEKDEVLVLAGEYAGQKATLAKVNPKTAKLTLEDKTTTGPVLFKQFVKVGDKAKVISGEYEGKEGIVSKIAATKNDTEKGYKLHLEINGKETGNLAHDTVKKVDDSQTAVAAEVASSAEEEEEEDAVDGTYAQGDEVLVLAGDYKGQKATLAKVNPKTAKLTLEDKTTTGAVLFKQFVKVGDKAKVISGEYEGKEGTVSKIAATKKDTEEGYKLHLEIDGKETGNLAHNTVEKV